MRPLFVGPVLFWCKRYVRDYVFAFCACGWGRVLFRNFWAGKICFYVFMFPENKPVDTALIPLQSVVGCLLAGWSVGWSVQNKGSRALEVSLQKDKNT
jgi:hypothetical protein